MPERPLGATVIKHSLVIAGHRTSVSLEAAFWAGLKAAALRRGVAVAALVAGIDRERGQANLSSAIRVFVLADSRGEGRIVARSGPSGDALTNAGPHAP